MTDVIAPPMDTRLLDCLESTGASIEYDAGRRRYLIYCDAPDGYREAYFGAKGEPLRAVLTAWMLNEKEGDK